MVRSYWSAAKDQKESGFDLLKELKQIKSPNPSPVSGPTRKRVSWNEMIAVRHCYQVEDVQHAWGISWMKLAHHSGRAESADAERCGLSVGSYWKKNTGKAMRLVVAHSDHD